MAIKISIEQVSSEIVNQLTIYTSEVGASVKSIAKDVSEKLVDGIKRDSPDSPTGRYKKGWKSKKVYEDDSNVRYRIFNKTDYQLTHLLELGHQIFTGIVTIKKGKDKGSVMNFTKGGRVEGIPHIKPNEEIAKTEFESRVKEAIKK